MELMGDFLESQKIVPDLDSLYDYPVGVIQYS